MGSARRRVWWTRWLVVAVVALELGYVVAGNSFLRHAWGRDLINRRPERLSVAWDRAYTWLPGLVHVKGLDLGGASRRVAWQARMDRGTMLVWLPSLARRHLRVLWGRPEGVEVDVGMLASPQEPRARRTKRGWRVTLGGLRLSDLRRIRTGGYELVGSGSLRGKANFEIRGPMELHVRRLLFDGAEVASGGAVVARDLDIDGGFDTRPFRAGQDTVLDLLGGASGRARLAAHVDTLGFLTAYLRGLSWLGLGGGGDLDLAVVLEDGSLLPGTSLSVAGPQVRADFFDFRAQGTGRVSAEVPADGDELHLATVLDEYSVTRLSDGAELLVGKGLETRFTGNSTSLRQPPTEVAGAVRVPAARVASLAAFGRYLPPGTTATVTGGSAELTLDLSYDTAAHSGRGELLIDAREVTGTLGDADVRGDVRLAAQLPEVDLLAGAFDVSGTEVAIADGRMVRNGKERTRGWWGRIRVTTGDVRRRLFTESRELVQAPGPARVTAQLQGRLLDTAPLVVLMEQRLPRLAWFDQLLTVPEIDLGGTVTLTGSAMGLQGLHVAGGAKDQLEIRAELDFAGAETSGVVYARYRALDAAVALSEGDRDWRLRRAKQAYEETAAAYRASREGG